MNPQEVNYPGFQKIKDPKDIGTVMKPKGDLANKKRVDYVYFDEDAEFDGLGIESTQPIQSKQFIELDGAKVKSEIMAYAEKSLDFAFDEKDFKRITLNRERNYVGMYAKLIILQAITTLMTKVYFSIPEPDRGLASTYKPLEKAPTWTTAYIGTIFADIGRFESEGIDYNFRNPLCLLRDLGDLFIAIWNLGPVEFGNHLLWDPNAVIMHYSNLDQWQQIGYGIVANDPFPRRVFIDAMNRLFGKKKFRYRIQTRNQNTVQNREFVAELSITGEENNLNNFVNGVNAAVNCIGLTDDEFTDQKTTAGRIVRQMTAYFANENDLGEGPIIDKRVLPNMFNSVYSSFTIANDRFFESARGRIHLHRNPTFTPGSRVQLAFAGNDVHHTARGVGVSAYVMETDICDFTPTEIGASTYHGMVHPIYRKRIFEFRNSDVDYVVEGTLRKQMERLTVKVPSKK